MLAKAAAVEKGEASSTTSSPKITNANNELECSDQRNSPESSTHPEVVSSSGVSPKSIEHIEENVSSTTKEILNLDFKTGKNSSSTDHSVVKAMKKVDVDPFGALIKDSTFAGTYIEFKFFSIFEIS